MSDPGQKTGLEMSEDFWRLASSTHKELLKAEKETLKALRTFMNAIDYPAEGVVPSEDEKLKYKEYKKRSDAIFQFMLYHCSGFKKLKKAFVK